MKKILFVLALFASASISAQGIENENIKAKKELEKKGYFGHFDYKLDDIHAVNVNYSITPKVPTSTATFSLHTPEDRPLSIVVTNSQGKQLISGEFSRNEYIKEGTLNLSSLKPGKYIYVIKWEDKEAFEIPFEKK